MSWDIPILKQPLIDRKSPLVHIIPVEDSSGTKYLAHPFDGEYVNFAKKDSRADEAMIQVSIALEAFLVIIPVITEDTMLKAKLQRSVLTQRLKVNL